VKQPKLKVLTPVWAQQIEVKRQGDTLLVAGWGRIPYAIDEQDVGSEHVSKLDIFKRFHNYVLRNLAAERRAAGDAGVYQFADANTDEKLIAFVEEFGPVWGKVRTSKWEENGTMTLVVAQSMEKLRNEQKRFAAVAKILQQVNRNSQADAEIIATQMDEVSFLVGYALALRGNLQYPDGPMDKETPALFWANRALCMVLNGYPSRLVPCKGEVFEMPDMNDEGIRNAIYWQLRRDYLAQRAIGNCLNCGGHFPIYKRGARACSESCRRALRNQKYWNKKKNTVNRARRKKRTGRK
jgi:hypothetical protein